MEVECIGNTQIIHMEETGITQRTIGLMTFQNLNMPPPFLLDFIARAYGKKTNHLPIDSISHSHNSEAIESLRQK